MNELSIFSNPEFGEVRGFLHNDEPWFIANDVCAALGLVNTTDALESLDLDEVSVLQTLSNSERVSEISGLRKDTRIVSESGLYVLVFKSRKPNAKRFRRWVTGEVLPAIRKTGSYGKPTQPTFTPSYTEQLGALRMMLEAAQLSPDAVALGLNAANRALTGADMLAASGVHLSLPAQDAALTPTQIAEIVQRGMTARKINRLLARKGFQEKQAGVWVVLGPGKPYMRHEPVNKVHSNGTPVIQLKWFRTIVPLVEAWLDS